MSSKRNDSDALQTRVHARARPFLDLVDELRACGLEKDVPIPQIAVMGDQSSGKSSVLEALSGIAFPRGSGLVTRCPTQVTMSVGRAWRAEVSSPALDEVHTLEDDRKEEIAELIQAMTGKLIANSSGSDFPDWTDQKNFIRIKVTSPDVPDLTIIDLPGIVRTTTGGQDKSVIKTVNAMLNHFLQQPRTCILAVVPANQDLACSEILERAKQVDPDGTRTIGVLTKPDLVDDGAERQVVQVLANVTKPLKHGYFMVKNRSQKDLNEKKSWEEAKEEEALYFKTSPYTQVAPDNLGVGSLAAALTDLLVQNIETALPDITQEVDETLRKAQQDLQKLGEAPPESAQAQRIRFSGVVREIAHEMRTLMMGSDTLDGSSNEKLLCLERRKRKQFVAAVFDTKPGFGGEHDSFKVKVTDVGEGALDDGVAECKVGDVVEQRSWTKKRPITNIGESLVKLVVLAAADAANKSRGAICAVKAETAAFPFQ
jgi:interferon-induced GTP-binding protein Mx1